MPGHLLGLKPLAGQLPSLESCLFQLLGLDQPPWLMVFHLQSPSCCITDILVCLPLPL